MERAAELIQCAAILHNICILFNDDGADLLDDEDLEIDEGESAEQDEGQEDRRQELLAHFLWIKVRQCRSMWNQIVKGLKNI